MTKEEKLELIKKLDTQIDGVEAYIRQLEENGTESDTFFLRMAEKTLSMLRREIKYYEKELNQWRD